MGKYVHPPRGIALHIRRLVSWAVDDCSVANCLISHLYH